MLPRRSCHWCCCQAQLSVSFCHRHHAADRRVTRHFCESNRIRLIESVVEYGAGWWLQVGIYVAEWLPWFSDFFTASKLTVICMNLMFTACEGTKPFNCKSICEMLLLWTNLHLYNTGWPNKIAKSVIITQCCTISS